MGSALLAGGAQQLEDPLEAHTDHETAPNGNERHGQHWLSIPYTHGHYPAVLTCSKTPRTAGQRLRLRQSHGGLLRYGAACRAGQNSQLVSNDPKVGDGAILPEMGNYVR